VDEKIPFSAKIPIFAQIMAPDDLSPSGKGHQHIHSFGKPTSHTTIVPSLKFL